MQINKITIEPNHNNKAQKSNNRKAIAPSFKGFDSFVVNVMDSIERGGLVASFTTQDMLGTNLPRPFAALSRNKKENQGKKNTTFALKEALREFTTGPSMFAIPAAILFVAKKSVGKAMDVPVNFIKELGEIFKAAPLTAEGTPITKGEFYKNVFSNLLKNSTTSLSQESIDAKAAEFAQDLLNIEKAKPKSFLKNFRGIKVDGSQQDLVSELLDKYITIMKSHNTNPLTDYTSGTLNVGIKGVDASSSFINILTHMRNYADDILEKTSETINIQSVKPSLEKVTELINNTNAKRICGRFKLNLLMAGAVLVFLPFIPKIYNVSKDNPALRGLEKPIQKDTNESTTKGAN